MTRAKPKPTPAPNPTRPAAEVRGRSPEDVARYKALVALLAARKVPLRHMCGGGANNKEAVAYRMRQAADPTAARHAGWLEWFCSRSGIAKGTAKRAMADAAKQLHKGEVEA